MILGGFCPLLTMSEYNIKFEDNLIKLFTPYSEDPFVYDDLEYLFIDLSFLFESEVINYEKES